MQVAFCRTRLSDSAGMWGVIVALVTIVLVRIAIKSYRLHGGGLARAPGRFVTLAPFRMLSEYSPRFLSEKIMNVKFEELFARQNSSVLVYRSMIPSPDVQCIVADADAAKAVFTDRRAFGKPIQDYEILKFFGPNVVVTEGEEWRRHRKLTGPSFSEKNNAMVWDESRRIIEEWFLLLDSRQDAEGYCEDSDTVTTTLRMALMIISASAFGMCYSWPKDGEAVDPPPAGRTLGFITALKGTLDGTIAKLILPNWAYKLPLKYPRYVALCFDELEGSLRDMITERRLEKTGGAQHNDLFSALLKGDGDEEEAALSIDELLGNMYIFLLAGHETTAHTLAFIFTLLALYPEHQQVLFDEASSAFGDRQSEYSDYSSLPYALGTVCEALRLFPPVLFIPKIALEDATIPAHTATPGEEPVRFDIFLPKGSRVAIASSALHHNPMYYPEPDVFRPSRFIDTPDEKWNRDAWVPFSGGIRACLGQKFALVESVAVLSHVCLNYIISVPPRLQAEYAVRAGESEESRRARIFKVTNGITLTPGILPLLFKRRPTSKQ